jgi:hypothetical protein
LISGPPCPPTTPQIRRTTALHTGPSRTATRRRDLLPIPKTPDEAEWAIVRVGGWVAIRHAFGGDGIKFCRPSGISKCCHLRASQPRIPLHPLPQHNNGESPSLQQSSARTGKRGDGVRCAWRCVRHAMRRAFLRRSSAQPAPSRRGGCRATRAESAALASLPAHRCIPRAMPGIFLPALAARFLSCRRRRVADTRSSPCAASRAARSSETSGRRISSCSRPALTRGECSAGPGMERGNGSKGRQLADGFSGAPAKLHWQRRRRLA